MSNRSDQPADRRLPLASQVMATYLRQRRQGSTVTEAELLAEHALLGETLRAEFEKIRQAEAGDSAAPAPDRPSSRVPIRCPHCGALTDADADASFHLLECASCKQQFSLVRERSWPQFVSHFELLERIGMGGFGTVWRARDTKLNRMVALKLPRRRSDSSDEADQFLREARMAANLNHPHIVKVYEIGAWQDEFYIVSELIEGAPLSSWLANGLPAAEAIALAIPIARAIHYAHRHGVIHRDLKPQNVIVDKRAKPYLSDFGLARQTAADVTMTSSGAVLGTPAYMSPEQTRGSSEIDHRTDIYSFGVLLYESLTGQLPFSGTLQNVFERKNSDFPPSPRSLNNRISRDLDTICMKCLERAPERRYQTAGEVADELRRVETGRPIMARPVSVWVHGLRWARRHPSWASLAVLLLLFVFGGGLMVSSLRSQQALTSSEHRHAMLAQLKETLASGKSGYRSRIYQTIRQHPELFGSTDVMLQTRDIALAAMGDFAGHVPRRLPLESVSTAAVSEYGNWVAVGYHDGRVELRSSDDLSTVHRLLQPSGDATRPGNRIMALGFPAGRPGTLSSVDQAGRLTEYRWGVSGSAAETTVTLEQLLDKRQLGLLRQTALPAPQPTGQDDSPPVLLNSGKFHASGQRLVFATARAAVLLHRQTTWDLGFVQSVDDLSTGVAVQCVGVSPDGRWLTVGYSDELGGISGLRHWDLVDDQPTQPPRKLTLDDGRMYENGLAFDNPADGAAGRLAIGCERSAVYDAASLQVRQSAEGSEAAAMAFSPDGAYLAVFYISGQVEIRYRKTNKAIATLDTQNTGGNKGVAFSQDGSQLLVWHRAGLQLMPLKQHAERLPLAGHRRAVPSVRFSHDGNQLISTSKGGWVRIWNSRSGQLLRERRLQGQVQCGVLAPDSTWLVTATWSHKPQLQAWSYPDLEPLGEIKHPLGTVCGVAFADDGGRLGVTGEFGTAVWRIGDSTKARELRPLELEFLEQVPEPTPGEEIDAAPLPPGNGKPPGRQGKFLLFSADSRRAFYADNWDRVRVYDSETGTAAHFRGPERDLENGFNSLAFTHDHLLAMVSPTFRVQLWDVSSPAARLTKTLGVPAATSTIVASGRGQLASLVDARTVGVWDPQTDRLLYRFRPAPNSVWALAWSPDGQRLAVGLSDGGLSIWDLTQVRQQLLELGFED